MAALIAARQAWQLLSTLEDYLYNPTMTLGSDSQIGLQWLINTKTLQPFVANKVMAINRPFPNSTWHHCPTDDNPADLVTRGISAQKMINSKLWWHDPDWLTNGYLPSHDATNVLLQASYPETTNLKQKVTILDQTGISKVVDIKRFSSLQQLIGVAAFVKRFIHNTHKSKASFYGQLRVSELNIARATWIKECQSVSYSKELQYLQSKTGRPLNLIKKLRLFVKHDVNRCSNRLQNAPLEDDVKFSIFLPAHHPITEFIVKDAHANILHAGLNSTVTYIRQQYWIPRIRQYFKGILRRGCSRSILPAIYCHRCEFHRSSNYQVR